MDTKCTEIASNIECHFYVITFTATKQHKRTKKNNLYVITIFGVDERICGLHIVRHFSLSREFKSLWNAFRMTDSAKVFLFSSFNRNYYKIAIFP